MSLDAISMSRDTANAQRDLALYMVAVTQALIKKGAITEEDINNEAQAIQRQKETGVNPTRDNN